ncbi:WD40 repeat-like protein [Rhizoctonia solani]|uniref:WD40 repeat-like protein n=1 Tax=Rhizoctonia solani TaxID=456999 RepID=A0A8H7H5P1_9AGAM|nr:WD40 repeat-like protein [Rhizoctonia solani]
MEHEGSKKKQKKRLGGVLSLRKWLRSPEDKDGSNSETFSSSGAPTLDGLSVIVGSGQSNNVAPSSMAKESSQAIQSSTSSTSALDTTAPVQEVAEHPWSTLEKALQALSITRHICPSLASAADDLRLCLPMTTRKIEQDYKNITAELKSVLELIAKHMNDVSFEESSEAISVISQATKKEIEAIGVHQSRRGAQRVLGSGGDDDDVIRRYRRIEQLFRQIQGEASLSTWNTANKQHTRSKPGSTPVYPQRSVAARVPKTPERKFYKAHLYGQKSQTQLSLCVELQARKQLAASFFCTRTSPECREAKRIVPTIAYQFARRSTPFRSALCKALEEDPDIGVGHISSQFELLLRRPLIKARDRLPNNLVIVIDALDECIDPRVVEDFLSLLFRSAMDLPVRFYVTSRPEPAIRDRMMVESERSRLILYLHEIEHSLVKADIELYLREELAFMSPADADVKKLAAHAGNLFIYAATAVRYICPRKKGTNSRTRLSVILAINMESKQKLSGIDDLYTAILTQWTPKCWQNPTIFSINPHPQLTPVCRRGADSAILGADVWQNLDVMRIFRTFGVHRVSAAVDDQALKPYENESILDALWAVVCACELICISTLAALSGLDDVERVQIALQPLRSVLHVSDHSELVTTLHTSFPDYMFDKKRSGRFHCEKVSYGRFLAERCFIILKRQLRFNICAIKSSYTHNDEISGIEEIIHKNVSEDLFYASRFWIDHLTQTEITDDLITIVQNFLSQKLLFWMEVLSLKKCLNTGIAGMTRLNTWLAPLELVKNQHLLKLASDASKFIASYASSPASGYAPHVYISALPLSPPSSYIRSYYLPRFNGLPKVSGPLTTWKSTFPFSFAVFLRGGDLIALVGENGLVNVQNIYNGKHFVAPFNPHNGPIKHLGVSKNGTQLIFVSHRAVAVWSMQDGSLIVRPFMPRDGVSAAIELSPDGVYIASGSFDGRIDISNLEDPDPILPVRTLMGHTSTIGSIDFSSDGARVVSASSDKTIRMWDVYTGNTILFGTIWGEQLSPPPPIKEGSVPMILGPQSDERPAPVKFSRDGSHIISVNRSFSDSIRIWNTSDGSFTGRRFPGEKEYKWTFALSPGGEYIAVVPFPESKSQGPDYSTVVEVWNMHTGILVAGPLKGHTGRIKHLGFSDDGTRIISASYDGTVRVWDTHDRLGLLISPDQTRVAAAFDSSVDIWDSRTMVLMDRLSIGSKPSESLCFQISLDNARIFTISTDGRMCTWDAHTSALVDGPHPCSTERDLCSAVCSADGTRIVSWNSQIEFVELWDAQLHRSITYCKTGGYLYSPRVMLAQKGRRFITEVHYPERLLNIWDTEYGAHIAGPLRLGETLDFSPDGLYVVCQDHNNSTIGCLHVISVDSGDKVFKVDAPDSRHIVSAKFSWDGLSLVYNTRHTCYLWNTRDHTIHTIITEPAWTSSLNSRIYSTDGRYLASASDDETKQSDLMVWSFPIDKPSHITIRSDGWAVDSQSRVVFWVPAEIRKKTTECSGIVIEEDSGDWLCVDYNDMVVGDEWSHCYIGN